MSPGSLRRAAWRWHFYAGLIVLPMLLWLAATGALYLYKPEIEAWLYAKWSHVEPAARPMRLDAMIATVERQSGGKVRQVMRPAASDASWRMSLAMPGGGKRLAFVDPYRGTLLGSVAGGGAMATVKDLHSLAITGPIGNALVEIVAGWAIVLVVTGLWLWWPRRGSPVVALRGKPSGRLFWRDLHAAVGLFGGGVILFLALTGMPWTGVAGKSLQAWVADHGLGRPAAGAYSVGGHAGHAMGAESLPWSMQATPPPANLAHGGRASAQQSAEAAAWAGLAAPWTLTLPVAPGAPYQFSAAIVRAEDAHVVAIDSASGRELRDVRYWGFGAGARWIEWGIAAHQGQQYGEPNRLVMLFGCLALWALALTGPLLWWKRRNGRGLAAPPAADSRSPRVVAALMLALGLLLPLTGITMIAALAGEQLWRRLERLIA
ncbi:PepSY domain-containing protein [Sphingomonas sp.]|uniref:PepSY-associated TM helix domain-containing protein n=1 Tax=Sphingomonas sp. TaxID=28214 RepID=UPI001B0DDC59|nr:PepSY domain-containing protein [Sphingomonas sp.]MBO9713858.1 PepSY domain-containing protein [Sphingomonas sp.]